MQYLNVKSSFTGDSHHDLLIISSTGIKPMQWYQGMFAFGWQAFDNPKCLGAKTIHCLYSFYFLYVFAALPLKQIS